MKAILQAAAGRTVMLAVGLSTLLACAASFASAQSTCRAADDWTATNRPLIDSIMNGLTASYRATRDSLRISAPSRSVSTSVVTSTNTCAAAGRAMDLLDGLGTTTRRMHVYKVDKYYVVDDPDRTLGEFRALAFFTSQWVYKGAVTQ